MRLPPQTETHTAALGTHSRHRATSSRSDDGRSPKAARRCKCRKGYYVGCRPSEEQGHWCLEALGNLEELSRRGAPDSSRGGDILRCQASEPASSLRQAPPRASAVRNGNADAGSGSCGRNVLAKLRS